jgi:hypothetical protein
MNFYNGFYNLETFYKINLVYFIHILLTGFLLPKCLLVIGLFDYVRSWVVSLILRLKGAFRLYSYLD